MELKTQTYYHWNDVQKEICKRLDIQKKYFRDYHEVIGGEYKDIWHLWLDYVGHNVHNDQVCPAHAYEPEGYIPEEFLDRYGEWIKPVMKIFDDVVMEYNTDGYTSMNILYEW